MSLMIYFQRYYHISVASELIRPKILVSIMTSSHCSFQKQWWQTFETKILVSNRFKLLNLPSYIMLFLSDQAEQFVFQGSFAEGSRYEQLVSCIALFISSVCFIYLLKLHSLFNYISQDCWCSKTPFCIILLHCLCNLSVARKIIILLVV